MPDYSISVTLRSIWTISRIFFDVAIIWFVIYYAMKFVRNNARTIQIFKGIILVLIINGLAKLLGLTTVAYFSDTFISWGFLAVIIIFQPEIRGLLERIGKTGVFSRITSLLSNEKERLVDEVYKAVMVLSEESVGALITIEQSQSMQDYIKTGIAINATVSKELLTSIFITTTPLHDGAVIIQGDKIACASAYFPPTNEDLPSRYGARHRAALGISEVTDALTIVVSEETSGISIAEKGKIFAVDEVQLKDHLRKVILNDEIEIRADSRQRTSLFIDDDSEVVITKSKEQPKSFGLFGLKKKKEENKEDVRSEIESEMKVPRNNRKKYDYFKQKDKERQEAVLDDTEVIEIKDNTGGEEDGQKS